MEMGDGRGKGGKGDKFLRKNAGAHVKGDLTFIML